MKYYQELAQHIARAIKAHPRSTVVMDSRSFKIIARGRDTAMLTRKLRRAGPQRGIPVVFQRPDENVVWILRNRALPGRSCIRLWLGRPSSSLA